LGIRGHFSFQKRNSCLNSKAVNHFRIFTEKKSKIIFEKNAHHHEGLEEIEEESRINPKRQPRKTRKARK